MINVVQFFSGVGTLPALLQISVGFCRHHEDKDQVCEDEMEVSNRKRNKRMHMFRSKQFLELERKRERLLM
jgi:hypothetical protein